MARSDFFAGAPAPSRDFNEKADELRPPTDAVNWPTHDEQDRFDLSDRALTPGGELEYRVHKEVRVERSTRTAATSLADEKELDFGDKFAQASGQDRGPNVEMSPDALRSSIANELNDVAKDLGRGLEIDRGGPER